MTLSLQDALINLMVVAATSDFSISERELARIEALVGRLPVFEGYDKDRLAPVARECVQLLNDTHSLDALLDSVIAAIPERLHDTAYALAVEVTAVDLDLKQEELRFLEMVRDRLTLDRLVTAAIEAAARARLRRA
jgi:hypothetical protein